MKSGVNLLDLVGIASVSDALLSDPFYSKFEGQKAEITPL
jgi:hypothetical protein